MMIMPNYSVRVPFTGAYNTYPGIKDEKHHAPERGEYFEIVKTFYRREPNANCMPDRIQTSEEQMSKEDTIRCEKQYRKAFDNGINVESIEKDPIYDFYNVDLNLYGKMYRFKSYEPNKYLVLCSIACSPDGYDKENYNKSIAKMLDNIKNTQFGSFVKYRNHEYYIPNVFDKVPDIRNDVIAIEHGNAETKENYLTKMLCKELSQITGQDVNMDNLKTINYLYKTKRGYSNNILQTAYAFHDSENDMHYMYIAEKNTLKIMAPNGYVMTEKLF